MNSNDELTGDGDEDGQNKKIIKDAFLYALNKMGYDIINTYVDKIGEDRKILKEEKESFIRCYKCVFVGSLLGWLEEDGSYDLSDFFFHLSVKTVRFFLCIVEH